MQPYSKCKKGWAFQSCHFYLILQRTSFACYLSSMPVCNKWYVLLQVTVPKMNTIKLLDSRLCSRKRYKRRKQNFIKNRGLSFRFPWNYGYQISYFYMTWKLGILDRQKLHSFTSANVHMITVHNILKDGPVCVIPYTSPLLQ